MTQTRRLDDPLTTDDRRRQQKGAAERKGGRNSAAAARVSSRLLVVGKTTRLSSVPETTRIPSLSRCQNSERRIVGKRYGPCGCSACVPIMFAPGIMRLPGRRPLRGRPGDPKRRDGRPPHVVEASRYGRSGRRCARRHTRFVPFSAFIFAGSARIRPLIHLIKIFRG